MSEKKPLRFGVISAARIVPNALIEAAKAVPEVAIVAIAARDPARAREFAKQHRIPTVHRRYDDMINDREVDVIYNPLPNSLHLEWTVRALRAGKPVLCEKPIASNAREAAEMAKVARETGLLLGEAFHYHYHPLAERVRTILRDGTIGRLQHMDARFTVPIPPDTIRYDFSLGGGATMDLGCYPLHMLRYFSGLAGKVVGAKAKVGPPNIDVAMDADLEFAGGVTAHMTCAMDSQNIEVSFKARGDRGELSVLNPVAPHRGNRLSITAGVETKNESPAGDSTYTYQLRAFAAAVRGDGKFPTDADAAIENMRVIDDVYRAAGLPLRGT